MRALPEAVGLELERVARRWRELPLGHALAASPAVRALVDDLAARTAPGERVPDLGPAALLDQLTVLVWDVCALDGGLETGLAARLAALRAEVDQAG